jgi:hypothetical protein
LVGTRGIAGTGLIALTDHETDPEVYPVEVEKASGKEPEDWNVDIRTTRYAGEASAAKRAACQRLAAIDSWAPVSGHDALRQPRSLSRSAAVAIAGRLAVPP